jgi:hypothetical protein
MYIKDIIDRYAERHYVSDDLIKSECFEFVKLHIDKCNLDMSVKGYVATLVVSYFTKFISQRRLEKIEKVFDEKY